MSLLTYVFIFPTLILKQRKKRKKKLEENISFFKSALLDDMRTLTSRDKINHQIKHFTNIFKFLFGSYNRIKYNYKYKMFK